MMTLATRMTMRDRRQYKKYIDYYTSTITPTLISKGIIDTWEALVEFKITWYYLDTLVKQHYINIQYTSIGPSVRVANITPMKCTKLSQICMSLKLSDELTKDHIFEGIQLGSFMSIG